MTVTVYNDKIEEVGKKLESLRKKAEKYGSSFNYQIGEPYIEKIPYYYDEQFYPGYGYATKKTEVRVEAVDVEIDDMVIRKDGWTAVAKIEHMDEGNLVTSFDGRSYPEEWAKIEPYCDHCKTNHQRNVTYMVQNEDGQIRQVGSSCLKDYTGIDPKLALSFAALVSYLEEEAYVDDETFERSGAGRLMNVEFVIALACEAVSKWGYRKSDSPNSTKSWVLDTYRRAELSKESEEKAEKIVKWILNDEHDTFSYEWESKPLVATGWCKAEHVGRLVWLPVAYDRDMERRERLERRKAENAKSAAVSKYVGEVGKKIEVEIKTANLITSWENQWGVTFLYKFTDVSGNVIVWFASSSQDIDGVKKLKGTVKSHSERDGVKQTVVTRCTLTVEKPEPMDSKRSHAQEGFDLLWDYLNGNELAFEDKMEEVC